MWLGVVASILVVSVCLRFASQSSYRITKTTDPVATSFYDSFWFSVSTFFAQSHQHKAKRGPLRCISSFWFLFCVVMYSAYTAVLVSILAVHEFRLPFQTLQEMVTQKEVKYGVNGGSVGMLVFKDARSGIYKDIYKGIMSNKDNVVYSNSLGMKKVSNEKYAFVSDISILKKEMAGDCRIAIIKERFYKTGLGLAVRENWPYKQHFDQVILSLIEYGFIEQWTNQFKIKTDEKCQHGVSINVQTLGIEDLASAFYILGIGLALGTIVLTLEIAHKKLRPGSDCMDFIFKNVIQRGQRSLPVET